MPQEVLSEFRIREAQGEDLEDLTCLENACFAEPWSAASLAEELAREESLWLLALGDEAVGYACFLVVAGEAELLRLAVDPSVRRKGVGRALLCEGLDRLQRRGDTICFLEVAAANHAAIGLYESLGFRRVGRRQGYYREGDDALLYRRQAS